MELAVEGALSAHELLSLLIGRRLGGVSLGEQVTCVQLEDFLLVCGGKYSES